MSNDFKVYTRLCVCLTVVVMITPDWQFSTALDRIDVTLKTRSLSLSLSLSLSSPAALSPLKQQQSSLCFTLDFILISPVFYEIFLENTIAFFFSFFLLDFMVPTRNSSKRNNKNIILLSFVRHGHHPNILRDEEKQQKKFVSTPCC